MEIGAEAFNGGSPGILELERGDKIEIVIPGGGFGNPLERPVEAVIEDIRDSLISAEHAKTHYRLVYGADAVDATRRLRAEMRETAKAP